MNGEKSKESHKMSNISKSEREKLEPTCIGGASSILNICGPSSKTGQVSTKPNFSDIPKSSVLANVKSFLPQMKKADEVLKSDLAQGKDVDIENVKEEQYVEMNVGLFETNSENWSVDSDPDSPPSPAERDNAFTSDSDSSSSSSVSSSSAGEDPEPTRKKKPIIEEME